MNLRFPLFYLIFSLSTSNSILGQGIESNATYYNWYDQMVERSLLCTFNGLEYVENYRVLNEKHKFFDNPNFSIGSIVYDGQPYFNIALKYDLFEDQLLLKILNQPNDPTIILDNNKVSNFEINGHQFKNIHLKLDNNTESLGYMEVLLSNDSIVLYKKYKKRIRTKTNDRIRYYEFKEANIYYVYYEQTFFYLKNSSGLSSIFSSHRSKLNIIEEKYKNLKKTSPESYLISVLEDLFNDSLKINQIEK